MQQQSSLALTHARATVIFNLITFRSRTATARFHAQILGSRATVELRHLC